MIAPVRSPEQQQRPQRPERQSLEQSRAQMRFALRRVRRASRRIVLLAIAWLLTRQLGIAARIQHKLTRSLVSCLNELERGKQQRD